MNLESRLLFQKVMNEFIYLNIFDTVYLTYLDFHVFTIHDGLKIKISQKINKEKPLYVIFVHLAWLDWTD